MKILFAVSNENVSNKIVEIYRKKYGNIDSFKNVLYFNAIIKEIQRDKTYDRIVISEDLEPFSNNNYDVIDKFILERLQDVSRESYNQNGQKIDIIIICTDRRTKSGYVLSKMYELGIYNALVGADRRIDNVCSLLQNPRTAEEAKEYYKIANTDTSNNSIDDVSEQEVQNILIHYKKLGKNEDRYADSFNNIAAQYTDKQLRIIIKCLPINVRAVLEAECPKYQELVTSMGESEQEKRQKEKIQEQRRIEQFENDKKLKNKIEKERREAIRNPQKDIPRQQIQTRSGIDLLDNKKRQVRMTGNVIIPNNMNVNNERKLYSADELENIQSRPAQRRMGNIQSPTTKPVQEPNIRVKQPYELEDNELDILPGIDDIPETQVKRPQPQQQRQSYQTNTLPGLDDELDNNRIQEDYSKQELTLPGLEDDYIPQNQFEEKQLQMEAVANQPEIPQEPKRKRGRPRKNPETPPKPKGKRGRPRKNPLPEETQVSQNQQVYANEVQTLPEIEEQNETQSLPGLEDFDEIAPRQVNERKPIYKTNPLQGTELFEDEDAESIVLNSSQVAPNEENNLPEIDDNQSLQLPGLEDFSDQNDDIDDYRDEGNDFSAYQNNIENSYNSNNLSYNQYEQQDYETEDTIQNDYSSMPNNNMEEQIPSYSPSEARRDSIQKLEENKTYQTGSLDAVLTKDKKIVAFVGASKSGTSFLINNLACLFSSLGVKTAILDMTKNKNSYYIYTNNDEKLRNIAYSAIEKLESGTAEGINVDRNLTVYTTVPDDDKDYSNSEAILSTLVQNESLILIDCDFETDLGYFANAQEIYLVQSMDILTIQPLTAFLRELKTKGILEPEKLRVVINKELKVKNLSSKAVIGGMSFYNDPTMSYMTELFNKDRIKACTIPFDENVYSKYLEAMVNCVISINSYNKNFMNSLKILGNMVYPLLSKQTYSPKQSAEMSYGNNFSNEMNKTLNQMKKKY